MSLCLRFGYSEEIGSIRGMIMKCTKGFFLLSILVLLANCENPTTKVPVPEKSSEKRITSFSFYSVPGQTQIGPSDITISVDSGTDVTSLVPKITYTGVSINPNSGEVQDFTNPVTYVVRAEDGSSVSYMVTVVLLQDPLQMTLFQFESLGIDGVIGTDRIDFSVPIGTDVQNLIASFATGGGTVEVDGVLQISGITANNFQTPKSYIVNTDSANRSYWVKVRKGNWASYDSSHGLVGNAIYGVTFADSKIYVSTDSGISVSEDSCMNWETVSSDIIGRIAVSGSTIVGTGWDSLVISNDRGETWRRLDLELSDSHGLIAGGGTNDVMISGEKIYLSATIGLGIVNFGDTSLSGITRMTFDDDGVEGVQVYNGIIYVAAGSFNLDTGGIWHSVDQGVTWEKYDSFPSGFVDCISVDNSGIYVGTLSGLFVSRDDGETWQNILPENWITDLAIQDTKISASTSSGVQISLDRGVTWGYYTYYDGLASSGVYETVIADGVFCIATESGLSVGSE